MLIKPDTGTVLIGTEQESLVTGTYQGIDFVEAAKLFFKENTYITTPSGVNPYLMIFEKPTPQQAYNNSSTATASTPLLQQDDDSDAQSESWKSCCQLL